MLRWSAAGAAVCGAGLLRVGREAAQGREAGAVEFFLAQYQRLVKRRNQKKSEEISKWRGQN